MSAKEYLISQLSDPYVEATSVQTQTALSAYAIRVFKGVDGYSINDAIGIIKNCGIEDEKFIKRCTDFISNINAFMTYQSRIPNLDD